VKHFNNNLYVDFAFNVSVWFMRESTAEEVNRLGCNQDVRLVQRLDPKSTIDVMATVSSFIIANSCWRQSRSISSFTVIWQWR
jgi:hypothetical protein